jgi:thiamine biosynthesis protein ThiI
MKYTHIIIRYGELTTKGKNRKEFTSMLLTNLKKSLTHFPSLEYDRQHDRMFIALNDEDPKAVADGISKIFGLSSYSLALKTSTDLDSLKAAALEIIDDGDYKTFKVKTKRQDKNYPMISDEVNRHVAGYILGNRGIKVDVHDPDCLLSIDIRRDEAYLSSNKIVGAGGYPVGVNGKALMMISGGIDSPVAAYLTMKRGIRIECIHFESSPYTSLQALNKVYTLVRKLCAYQGEIYVHVIPFTDLQLAIYEHCDESYAITIMRRMMYRIADKIAKERNILAISNGESVGQVASQTIESAYVISNVTDRVVYRPLAMFDKQEIIDMAVKLDTYETSILPYEDCCTIFEPKSPTTRPKPEKCAYYESRFDYESLIDQCIEHQQVVKIDQEYNMDSDIF